LQLCVTDVAGTPDSRLDAKSFRSVDPHPLDAGFRDRAMSSKSNEFHYGAPGETAVHICVDMQRMFAEATDWKMPWLERVLPNIVAITAAHPERTIFTRFIPARKAGQGVGMWRRYYERWESMTLEHLGSEMICLVADLANFVPPARTFRPGPAATSISSCSGPALIRLL